MMSKPSPWVERHAGLIRAKGEVLDLACGNGRHAQYLASLDKRVTAVDVDISRVTALADHDRIEIIEADLAVSAAFPVTDPGTTRRRRTDIRYLRARQ
jgi:2-polyprenyl-3-methyl-5-hydroxy-6-metoxy-1,4-benzoquinol methylase